MNTDETDTTTHLKLVPDADPYANDPDLLLDLTELEDPYGDTWQDDEPKPATGRQTVEVNDTVTLWGLVALEAIITAGTIQTGHPVIGLAMCTPIALMSWKVYQSGDSGGQNPVKVFGLPRWMIGLAVVAAALVVVLLAVVRP